MSDIAIRVENLSKRYLLGHQANTPKDEATLRDNLVGAARGLLRRTKEMARGGALVAGDSVEEFWALKDVCFEVNRGDVVGIIGRNGAGKSTLLKILSRITEPTSGRITLNGRVSSLLEVGTGFHPELSGRENIFLNGAILGMSRKEIQANFDEIVDFAEVEKFLDTPVKRYSSGMYVRLAFAVAAHLEPEILIVDEVLAVGDVQFQKKCLGKMGKVAESGRTVFFVSHNMSAVEQLTRTCLYLQNGTLIQQGRTADILNTYLIGGINRQRVSYDLTNHNRKWGNGAAKITAASYDRPQAVFLENESLDFYIDVVSSCDADNVRVGVTVFSLENIGIATAYGDGFSSIRIGKKYKFHVSIHDHRLAPGFYNIGMSLGTGDPMSGLTDFDVVLNILEFEVKMTLDNTDHLHKWERHWGHSRLPKPIQTIITDIV